MTQVQYTVEPQGRPLAVMVSIATLEQLVDALGTCSQGDYSTKHAIDPSFDEDAVNAAITAGRAALANAEPAIKRYVPTDIDAEVAAGTLVQTGPMEWRKP